MHSKVRRDAGDALADDQAMNVMRALVGVNRFEVVHVAHDGVIVHDAVCAHNSSSFARSFQRHPNVIHFQHGDVREVHFAGIFSASNVQRENCALLISVIMKTNLSCTN